jgi:hypothetical protein
MYDKVQIHGKSVFHKGPMQFFSRIYTSSERKLSFFQKKIKNGGGFPNFFGPSEVRAPAVGVAHAGGERSVHY